MKVYLAARFDDRNTVRKMQEQLKQLGHEITADWTLHDPIARYGERPDLARAYAMEDLDGVRASDVFIFLTGPTVGTGTHTELGVAIAQNMTQGRPKIYVVGDHTSRSIMYFHPAVERRAHMADVFDEIGA